LLCVGDLMGRKRGERGSALEQSARQRRERAAQPLQQHPTLPGKRRDRREQHQQNCR
jgi:hypothetical protein